MLSLAVLRFCFLPVLLFLSTSHLVNGQPGRSFSYSSSSSSTGPGGAVVSSYNSNGAGTGGAGGAEPPKVRIVVKNGQMSTIYSGSTTGFVSSRVNPNGVYININGQVFKSRDTVGPYVVTNEPDGVLRKRDFTPEDAEMIRKQQEQLELHQQKMRDHWNAMNQQMQDNLNRMSSQMSMIPGMPVMKFPVMPSPPPFKK